MATVNGGTTALARYYTQSSKIITKIGAPWLTGFIGKTINTAVRFSFQEQVTAQNQLVIGQKPPAHIITGEKTVTGSIELQMLESHEFLAMIVGAMTAAGIADNYLPRSFTDLNGMNITQEFYGDDPAVPMLAVLQISNCFFTSYGVDEMAGANSTTAAIQFQAIDVTLV